MSHTHTPLTPRRGLRLARLVIESGWTYTAAARMLMVSAGTASKWAKRYRYRGRGRDGRTQLAPARSPTPHPATSGKQVVRSRWRHSLGPVQIAGRLGVPASMVHAALVRRRDQRLAWITVRQVCQGARGVG